MRAPYPILPAKADENSVLKWISEVTRERANDVSDYEKQEAVHPSFYPVPSSGTDLIGTEKEGDIAADQHHLYVVVKISGVLEWRRTSLTNFP